MPEGSAAHLLWGAASDQLADPRACPRPIACWPRRAVRRRAARRAAPRVAPCHVERHPTRWRRCQLASPRAAPRHGARHGARLAAPHIPNTHATFTQLLHHFYTTFTPLLHQLLHHFYTTFTPLLHHFYTTFTAARTSRAPGPPGDCARAPRNKAEPPGIRIVMNQYCFGGPSGIGNRARDYTRGYKFNCPKLLHHFYTTFTPHLHHFYTTFTPLLHHFYTTFTPHLPRATYICNALLRPLVDWAPLQW